MSKILNLKSYDFVLSYTWSPNNHGICGHTFEVIEYFWILKSHFNICILMAEDISYEEFKNVITSKYDFDNIEIEEILSKTIFHNRPSLLLCNNIILTDGGINSLNYDKIIANRYILFACGNKEIKNNSRQDTFILQDHRIYEKAKTNSVEYIKKILFSKLKHITKSKDRTLLYATKNCRGLTLEYYEKLLVTYSDDFLLLTNTENKLNLMNPRITELDMPVENLFEQFNKYMYTAVSRKFDCSPRFIAECKWYNKEVIYAIDYLNDDLGLYWRKYDIEHNFKSINLTSDDKIIEILKGIIC